MANNTAKSVTLTDKNTNEFLYPYTSDSLVKRTNSAYNTVKDALDALEAGGAATDRAYNSTKNVQGYMVLNPSTSSASIASQLQGKENYIIEIRDIIDLNDTTLTIPEGCTLKFVGGKIINGTLVGTDTVIDADPVEIFGDDVNIKGTWDCDPYAEWFDDDIQMCLDQFKSVHLLDRNYDVTSTIQMPYNGSITGIPSLSRITTDGTFPVINVGRNNTITGLDIYVLKPCTVFWINTQHVADTYYGRREEDAVLGRPLTGTNRDIGWANDPRGADRPYSTSSCIYIEKITVTCPLSYSAAVFSSEVPTKDNPSLNGPCIYVVSDGNYLDRNNQKPYSGFSGVRFRNIEISGRWHYAIKLETGSVTGITYGSTKPWLTDCFFDSIRISNCYNGIYLGVSNNNSSCTTTGPAEIKFSNISHQIDKSIAYANGVPGDYGCIFLNAAKCGRVYVDNCIPWDWKVSGYDNIIAYQINRDSGTVYFKNSIFDDAPRVIDVEGSVNAPYTVLSNTFGVGNIEKAIDCYNYGDYKSTGGYDGRDVLFKKVYGRYPVASSDSSATQEDIDYNTWVAQDTAAGSSSYITEQNLLTAYQNKLNTSSSGFVRVNSRYLYYNNGWSTTDPDRKCKDEYLRKLPDGTFYFSNHAVLYNYLNLDTTLISFVGPTQSIYGRKTTEAGGLINIVLHLADMKVLKAVLHLQPARNADIEDPISGWTYIYRDKQLFNTTTEDDTTTTALAKMRASKLYGNGQVHFLDNRLALCNSGSNVYDCNGMHFNPIAGNSTTRTNMLNPPSGSNLYAVTEVDTGKFYFDTDKNLPYWFNGTNWVSLAIAGSFSNAPVDPIVGMSYFLTEAADFTDTANNDATVSLNKVPIFFNGEYWTDVTGTKKKGAFRYLFSDGYAIANAITAHTAYPDENSDYWGTSNMFTVDNHNEDSHGRPISASSTSNYRVSNTLYRYNGSTFAAQSSPNKFITDFIPVTAGNTITLTNFKLGSSGNESQYPVIVAFTENDTLNYSKSHSYDNVTDNETRATETFTIPEDVVKIKIQIYGFYADSSVKISSL